MVIFPGERLPGDRRTARPSVRARRRGSVAARYRLLPVAGQETGGGAAAPKSPSSPATHRQLQAVNLTPHHELPPSVAIRSQNRPRPERPGAPVGRALETVEKLVTA
jgi:hypothetical protein